MQDTVLFTLGKYTLPMNLVEKVICKSVAMNSACCMNSEMEEVTVTSPEKGLLSLTSTEEWVWFQPLKRRESIWVEKHDVAQYPEPHSKIMFRGRRWEIDCEGLPMFFLCFKGGGRIHLWRKIELLFWENLFNDLSVII